MLEAQFTVEEGQAANLASTAPWAAFQPHAGVPRTGWRQLLLVDPHPLYALGFTHAVRSSDPQLEVLIASSVRQGLALAHTHPALDAVIVEHGAGLHSGLDGLRAFALQHPRLVRLLVTGDPSPYVVAAARAAGAAACLSKLQTPAEIGAALSDIAAGRPARSSQPDASPGACAGAGSLGALPTARQQAVLACLSQGLPNKRIARVLGISERTVKLHLTALLALLGAQNRTQLLVLARQHGLA